MLLGVVDDDNGFSTIAVIITVVITIIMLVIMTLIMMIIMYLRYQYKVKAGVNDDSNVNSAHKDPYGNDIALNTNPDYENAATVIKMDTSPADYETAIITTDTVVEYENSAAINTDTSPMPYETPIVRRDTNPDYENDSAAIRMDVNPAYGIVAIKMDINPSYGTPVSIKMDTNPAYATTTVTKTTK